MPNDPNPASTEPHVGPTIEVRDVSVSFPGVRALDGASLRLFPGEVHALLGENGAGKSTLIKALTGVHRIDGGEMLLDGRPLEVHNPAQARAAGISTVYQEVNLAANLSVAENTMLGREPRRFGRIDWRAMRRRAREVLEGLHLDIDPASPLESHSIAVQQLVSIARAVEIDAKVLILDEPTSSLDAREVDELFAVVDRVRASGVAVLFVTHFLDQVYRISDRITVLRNGKLVGEYLTAELPRLELVSKMIGRELAALEALEHDVQDEAAASARPAYVQASGIGRRTGVAPLDIELRPGEVLGMAGLLGSGRTETARLLFGADRPDSGEVRIDGRLVRLRSPRTALDHGIVYASENRRTEGLVGNLSVRANIVLAMQSARGWVRSIPRRQQLELADRYIKALDIRPTDPEAIVANLSGGNQQKVLLARWLLTEPRVLLLDEPTRGIDVGAKAEIQRLVAALADEGMAVMFISAELEEVLRLSHRIVVMRDLSKVAELPNHGTTVDDLMRIIADDAVTLPVPA